MIRIQKIIYVVDERKCKKMKQRTLGLIALLMMVGTGLAQAPNPAVSSAQSAVPTVKQTKLGLYMTPKEAATLMASEGAKTLFVDVRTRSELQFVGWTSMIDANVPFVEVTEFWDWDEKNKRFKLDANPTFSQGIEAQLSRKGLKKGDRIILMCRSGDRSARAVNALVEAGYTNVWNQIEGFEGDAAKDTGQRTINGWKLAGLPWNYNLDKAKMYLKTN